MESYSLGLTSSSFTDSEAQRLLGVRVRLNANFGRVPAATQGRVVGLLRSQILGIFLDIAWLMPGDWHDAFSKKEYGEFLSVEAEHTSAA